MNEDTKNTTGGTEMMPSADINASSLTTPIAIIVAGIIIAGAIFLKTPGAPSGMAPGGVPDGSGMLKKNTIAEEIGLNKKTFAACLESGRMAAKVEENYQSGIRAGVQGTPHNIVINTKTKKMYVIPGAQPASAVKEAVESALSGTGTVKASETPIDLDPVTPADHISGSVNAEVFIVEYSDPECPFCKRFHESMQEVMGEYQAGGKVAWVYRHFPLDAIHSKARKEAEATECAAEQGGNDAFWKYTTTLFKITPSNNQLNLELL